MKSVAFAAVFSFSASAAGQGWSSVESRGFNGIDGEPVPAHVVTIDMKRAALRIAATRSEAGQKRLEPEKASLRNVVQLFASQDRFRGRDWIVASAGFSSYSVDVPLGLLVIDGRMYSTLSTEKVSSSRQSSTSERYRWSGVLCRLKAGGWDIMRTADYQRELCVEALQAGPLLVEPGGKVGIGSDEPRRHGSYIRFAVCLTDADRLRLVLTSKNTHLLPFARWLADAQGLGCRVALNLAGEDSAGIAIKYGTSVHYLGEGTFPLPTVLIFEQRR